MNLNPDFLKWAEIRQIADQKRQELLRLSEEIPIPMQTIMEHRLKYRIEHIENFTKRTGLECFVLRNDKTIYIDKGISFDDRYLARYNFTLAHELGHIVLHSENIDNLSFKSDQDWINWRRTVESNDINWFEKQANEFAGRFLVPHLRLVQLIEEDKDNIELAAEKSRKFASSGNVELNDYLIANFAERNCNKFEVSSEVLEFRIRAENLVDVIYNSI